MWDCSSVFIEGGGRLASKVREVFSNKRVGEMIESFLSFLCLRCDRVWGGGNQTSVLSPSEWKGLHK